MDGRFADVWNAEYAAGRYRGEPPVAFVADIVDAANALQLRDGLYIGCGNGRNLLPLLDAGLDLVGLDISSEAISQLRNCRPDRSGSLVVGDLAALPVGARYDVVVAIQVLQHGTRAVAHRHFIAAADRVAPGGLFCIRVNATDTDIEHPHDRIEEASDGSYTIRYRSGPKAGIEVHFFTADELRELLPDRFADVRPLQLHSTVREPSSRGQWSQWEAIWRSARS
jgi:SAM-dependent methyltransferase